MEQKTIPEYRWMVRRRAFSKAWEIFGKVPTLLGIAVAIIVSVPFTSPLSLSDIIRNGAVMAALIFLLVFIVLLLWAISREPAIIHNEQVVKVDSLAAELATIKDNRPDVVPFNEPYGDVRPLFQTIDGKNTETHINCFHMGFANKPKNRIQEATAKRVYAQLTYYSHTKDRLIGPIYGRWGDTEQPGTRSPLKSNRDLLPVDFEASGLPRVLDLAIHHPGDDVVYAFNNDSYPYVGWKNPNFAINQKEIVINVQLSGDNMDDKDWWVLLTIEPQSYTITRINPPG